MSQEHDPQLQANFLRQCLSHDRRPLGVLLGAGCPTAVKVPVEGRPSPLIPDIRGITSRIANEMGSSALKRPYELALSHFKTDGLPDPNVEQLLSHIRSLRHVAGRDSVRGLSSDDLDSLDAEICRIIADVCRVGLPASLTPYHLLALWIGAIERVAPVEVFTTNYDLLMEQAFEANRVPYFDGFVGAHEAFFDLQSMGDKLPPRWARLWKIHGSLDWHEDAKGAVRRGSGTRGSRIIYPSHLKYDETRRMPYVAMVERLRGFLLQSSAVLVVNGFSFSDGYINEVLLQGLRGNPTSVAYALVYGKLGNYPGLTKLAEGRPNLTVMAADQGVVGARVCPWTRGKSAQDCSDSDAVEWLEDASSAGRKDAQFTLGDFARFGDFLEALLGPKPSAQAS